VPLLAVSYRQEPVAGTAERGATGVGAEKHRQNEFCGVRSRENAVSQLGSLYAGT
jgi:hypothetical protein